MSESEHITFQVGDVIDYRTWTGLVRRVRVTGLFDNGFGQRPGFDGVELVHQWDEDGEVFGFRDQVLAVIERAES